MNENTNANKEKSNKNKIILLSGFLIVLLLVYGVTFYLNYQKDKGQETEIANLNTERDEALNKLESISNELDLKIEEIKKLGGDVEELNRAKEELEKEKEQIVKNKNYQLSQLRDKVQGYEMLLKRKDEEIAKLQVVNQELLSENTVLKTDKNVLADSISQLSQTKAKLTEKVELASRLKAENIKVSALNNRGKAREGEFKNRQIDRIKIDFNLAENKVAPVEGKDILIRVVDPQGNILFDVATGAGTFMYEGKEVFYTAKQEILFDNSKQHLTFEYKKGGDFSTGKHTVEIFADNYIIGKEDFIVK